MLMAQDQNPPPRGNRQPESGIPRLQPWGGINEDANGEELEDEREAVQEWLEIYDGFAAAIAPDGDDVFVVGDAIADFRAANETVEQSSEEDEKKSGLRSLNDVARAVDYWSEANDVYLSEVSDDPRNVS